MLLRLTAVLQRPGCQTGHFVRHLVTKLCGKTKQNPRLAFTTVSGGALVCDPSTSRGSKRAAVKQAATLGKSSLVLVQAMQQSTLKLVGKLDLQKGVFEGLLKMKDTVELSIHSQIGEKPDCVS